MRRVGWAALFLAAALLPFGCAPTNLAEILKSAGNDPATVCANGVYAGVLINYTRTNVTNGEVQCNANGLTIKTQAVQLGIPAQVTIQQPVTVTGPAPQPNAMPAPAR